MLKFQRKSAPPEFEKEKLTNIVSPQDGLEQPLVPPPQEVIEEEVVTQPVSPEPSIQPSTEEEWSSLSAQREPSSSAIDQDQISDLGNFPSAEPEYQESPLSLLSTPREAKKKRNLLKASDVERGKRRKRNHRELKRRARRLKRSVKLEERRLEDEGSGTIVDFFVSLLSALIERFFTQHAASHDNLASSSQPTIFPKRKKSKREEEEEDLQNELSDAPSAETGTTEGKLILTPSSSDT